MDLRNRIKLLTARTTPISEPGQHIENKVEQIREIMPYVLAGHLEYVDTVRDYIGELREAYHGNNNRSVSNSIAKRVADKAEALLEEVIVAGSKRPRHTRKRKARKNKKTRRNVK